MDKDIILSQELSFWKKSLLILLVVMGISSILYVSILNSDFYIADDFTAYTPGFQERYSNLSVFSDAWEKLLLERKYSKNLEITYSTFRPLFNSLIIFSNTIAKGDVFKLRLIQFIIGCLTCWFVGLLFLKILNNIFGAIVSIISYIVSGSIAYQFTWLITNPYNMGILFFAICILTFLLSLENSGWICWFYQTISTVFYIGMLFLTESGIMLPLLAFIYSAVLVNKSYRTAIKNSFPLFIGLGVYLFFRFVWISFPILPQGSQYSQQAGALLFGTLGQYLQYFLRIIEAIIGEIVPWDYLTSWYGAVFCILFWLAVAGYVISNWPTYRKRATFVFIWVFLNALPLFAMPAIRMHFIIAIGPCLLLGWIAQDIFMKIKTKNLAMSRLSFGSGILVILWVGFLFAQYQGAKQLIKVMSSGPSVKPLSLGEGTLRFRMINSWKKKLNFDTENKIVQLKIKKLLKQVDWNVFSTNQDNLMRKCTKSLSVQQRELAKKLDIPPVIIHPEDGKVMVIIPSGNFIMGLQYQKEFCSEHEYPSIEVNINEPFYVDVTPVTWLEYFRVLENKNNIPLPRQADISPDDKEVFNKPMTGFTKVDAQKYAQILGKRLLSEAEFEYVSRAGKNNMLYPWGNDNNFNYDYGNFFGKSVKDIWEDIAPVAQFKPNSFGVFDTVGNVWEMVSTPWTNTPRYSFAPQPNVAVFVPLRGGSAVSSVYRNRFSSRIRWYENGTGNLGFRMVASISSVIRASQKGGKTAK